MFSACDHAGIEPTTPECPDLDAKTREGGSNLKWVSEGISVTPVQTRYESVAFSLETSKQEWSSQSKVEWKNVTQLKLVGRQWCDRPFRHLWPCSYATRILMENILLSWFYECFPTVTTEDSEKQMSSTMIHTKSHWWFFSDLFRPRYLAYFRHLCLLYSHSSWGTAHVFREAHCVCINLFKLWLPLASLWIRYIGVRWEAEPVSVLLWPNMPYAWNIASHLYFNTSSYHNSSIRH